ncbi:MAG: hypothetical protein ACKO23_21090 [Gemmataceae bacterium]
MDVQQPSSDTVVVTMTGVAVAYNTLKGSSAAMLAELNQCFEISFDSPKVKKAKLTMEGRVIGALRSHSKGGTAEFGDANAALLSDAISLLHVSIPGQSVCGGDSQTVNLREGPVMVPVLAGEYKLHQTFRVAATSCQSLCGKAPSAEFAPDALDPLWISYKEPFKGVSKKDFGFQVTIKVSDDTPAEPEKPEGNKAEKPESNKNQPK